MWVGVWGRVTFCCCHKNNINIYVTSIEASIALTFIFTLQINTSLLLLCFFLFPEWSQFCVSKLIWQKILRMPWCPIFCVVHKKRDVQSGLISAPLDFDACPKIWHKRGWKLSGNWNTAMWLALSTQFLLHFDEPGLAAIWICKQTYSLY